MSKDKKTEKKRGIGDAAVEAIKAKMTNDEALKAIKEEFPEAKTSLSSINWYRNKLRTEGANVPTARELKQKAKKEAEKAAKAKGKDPLE